MKSLTLAFSTALCLASIPVFAGDVDAPAKSVTLAQAEVMIGPNGASISERGRDPNRVRYHDNDRSDGDHDRRRMDLGDRNGDRGCKTVTVQERGETRTTRRCD